MTKSDDIDVAFTVLDDGTHLATSVSTPLFCVSADTEEAVTQKAQRAIDFWCQHRHKHAPRRTVQVTSFAPRQVKALPALACA